MADFAANVLGRQQALQVLYTSEIQDKPALEIIEQGLCLTCREIPLEEDAAEDAVPQLEDVALSPYAVALVEGVEEHLEDIDAQLQEVSENWTVSRMPVVDRSVLRIAVFEMCFQDDIPVSVAINEAVELAKFFGGEDESPRFVNGVLGRIAKNLEADGVAAEAADEAEEA